MFDIFDSYYMPSRTGRRRGTVFPSGFSFGSPYFSQDMDYEAAKKRKLAELEAQRRLYQQQQEEQAEIKRRKEQQLRAQQQLQERRRKAKQARKQRQISVHLNAPVNENGDSHVMEEKFANEPNSPMECEQTSTTPQPPTETEEEEQVQCDPEQCEAVSSDMKEEESEEEESEEEEEEQVEEEEKEEEEMEEETEDQQGEEVSGEPEAENETMSPVLSAEQAAVTIQAWFRLCLVRKTHLLEQLKQFRAVEQQVKQICQQYNRQITEQAKTGSQVQQLEKRLVLWKGYEDALVRQLICLDGISSRGSEIGRERRKHTVSQIQSLLSQIDQRKLKLQQRIEEAKQELQQQQQQQQQKQQEQEQRQKQQKAAHRSKAPTASRSKSAPLPGFPSFRQSPFYFNDF